MSLSKRAFLGAAAGGAVAAPSVAKSLLQETTGTAYGIGPHPTPYAGEQIRPDPNWPMSRIKNLMEQRERLKSERSFEGLIPSQNETHAAGHYDAMRSVSANARRLMFNERLIEMRKEGEMRWIDREIEDLKKHLGPLALVLS